MRQGFKGLLIGLAVLGVATPASAAPIAYTITGAILGGQDMTRVFGGSENLAGVAFTAVETFDPARAGSSWGDAAGSGASDQRGGFATVSLTIGGLTKAFSGLTASLSSLVGSQFNSEVKSGADEIGFSIGSSLIKADYTAPNAIGGLASAYAGHYTLSNASGSQIIWANFEVNSLTAASAVSAVPLPASAPMFGAGLLGLAALGFGRRRALARASR